MKKRCIAALVLTAALASQPAWAFAVDSASSSGSDDSGSISSSSSDSNKGTTSSKSSTTVSASSTGIKTTGATTSASLIGSTVGVVVGTVTTAGQQATTNSKGETVIGDTTVAFADSVAATTGLPFDVISAINDINTGKSPNEAAQGIDLTGYNAPIGTHTIIAKDTATGAVKTGTVKVSPYVPDLISSASNVQILFYDNTTGQWQLIPAIKVDPVTKTVTVSVPGSDALFVVHKD